MHITFFGAAEGVTGSKHVLETKGKKILLDCGLHQGRRNEAYELNKTLPFASSEISAAILSHAHADHCGTLPLLVKNGYTGKIYATPATADIARLIMIDAAKIQQHDFEYLTEHAEDGRTPLPPLYSLDDVESACQHFSRANYAHFGPEWNTIDDGIRFKFYNAGHILGSAITLIESQEDHYTGTLAFTGDLGNTNVPILQEPEKIAEPVENLVIESTYGDRIHRPVAEVDGFLIKVINEAVEHKRRIIVPAFALGRTQELIYVLHKLYDAGSIPAIPIYVDSPLGNDITAVFAEHYEEFDEDAWRDFFSKHESPFAFKNLITVVSQEESKKLNGLKGPCMIIASSGMCEGGRILHHLQHSVYDQNALIIITGYQAEHTLGRKLIDGVSPINIYDKSYEVNAEIKTINEFSAHADQRGLFNYIASLKGLKNVFLVHGERKASEPFKALINKELPKLNVVIPRPGERFEI